MSSNRRNNEAEVKKASNNSTNAESTTSAPQALQALPAELIGILAENLEEEDLLSVRATCRELHDGSAFEFCQRYLDLIEISGTNDSVQRLIAILTSPNFAHAKKTFTKLYVTTSSRWPHEENEELSPAEVTRLLRAMPGLKTANFMDDSIISNRNPPAIFFACMAQMPSQVHRVGLLEVEVKGDLLADMLEAHGNDLRTVILMTVTLDSLSGWLRVMEALHSTQTMHLKLMGLTYADHEAEAGTTDLSMGSFADFRRSEGGVAYVGHKYVDVSGGNVKPALEFIIQHIEKCVKERVGLGQSET